MELKSLKVEIPEGCNVILGHTHFIKSVEDLYEALIESGTALKFGIGFCEASGDMLVRSDGNDEELVKHAEREALKVGAGHSFIIFLKGGFPINVLNRVKNVSEVCRVFTATANPLEVIYVDTESGRAILGVSDGGVPKEVETADHKAARKDFLRKIGYKR
ncbi:TPA: adenosine monophosphate-protein transferase [Candidatus Micrarchaeota archaeon]|nr:adenosine monophosphate-protein transferase [Candidatus Micrarchaeota archaeon]